jgi:hypothetical protein
LLSVLAAFQVNATRRMPEQAGFTRDTENLFQSAG